MRTQNQQRYYEVLRREDGTQKIESRCGTAAGARHGYPDRTHSRPQSAEPFRVSLSVRSAGDGDAASPNVCDPLAELGIPSATIPKVTEFVSTHRSFTSLHVNFMRLEQLHSLVLEHNALESVQHLVKPPSSLVGAAREAGENPCRSSASAPPLYRGCRMLTHLYLSRNRLRDIARDTDIPQLSLLEHLSLAYNLLTDLDKVLLALKRLRHLHFLDLRGNPITGEPHYRQRCVAALPQVQVLDCQCVLPSEREAVAGQERERAEEEEQQQQQHVHYGSHRGRASRTSSPEATRRRGRTAPYAKSHMTRDLERKYVVHIQAQRQAQADAEWSAAATQRRKEETWKSFHAIWTLSQPGMPLSAEGWQRVQAAAAAATSSQCEDGGGEGMGTIAFTAPPSRVSTAAPLTRGGRGKKADSADRPIGATNAMTGGGALPTRRCSGSADCLSATPLMLEVPCDRPLYPDLSASSLMWRPPRSLGANIIAQGSLTQSTTDGPAVVPLPSLYDGRYFVQLRGDEVDDTFEQSTSAPLRLEEPSPERLATLRRTVQVSTAVVRAATAASMSTSTSGTSRPPSKPPSAQERVVTGRRGIPSRPVTATVPTVPVDYTALRLIQETKHAVIPPPWEEAATGERRRPVSATKGSTTEQWVGAVSKAHLGDTADHRSLATSHFIGAVTPTTSQQEALAELLVLLHDFYAREELQMLEREYGNAELLRLLPLREWSDSGSGLDKEANANTARDAVSTAAAARQAMLMLSRPSSASSANNGGGGASRGVAAHNERKRSATASKGSAHGSGSALSATGTTTVRGGAGEGAAGISAAAALAVARAALPSTPQNVLQLLTGPLVVAGATAGTSGGVVVTVTREDSSPPASPAAKKNSGGTTIGSSTAGAAASASGSSGGAVNGTSSSTVGSTSNAASGVSPATTSPVSLQDPETVQQLVRPIGPYAPHVLGPLLTLLKAPVEKEEEVQSLCDALVAYHGVRERVTCAAAEVPLPCMRATPAEVLMRATSAAATRSKKESLPSSPCTEDASGEGRRKKPGKAAGSLQATSTISVSSSVGTSSITSHFRSSAKAIIHQQQLLQQQLQLQQQRRDSVSAQLTLLSVLTALLFSPAFVRARVAYLEKNLARTAAAEAATPAAAVDDESSSNHGPAKKASPITSSSVFESGGGGESATLSQLFHRVQNVKMHAARVEAAAAAVTTTPKKLATLFLDPTTVLTTYTSRH